MKYLLVLVVIITSIFVVNGQDSVIKRAGISVNYHPNDFFIGLNVELEQKAHQHQLSFFTGVNHTFFQRRLYPKLHYQYSYHLVRKEWFQVGLISRFAISTIHFNKQSDHGWSFQEELLLGGYAALGRRNRYRLSTGIGPAVEQNWSYTKNKFAHFISWNTFVELTWSYAF